MVCSNCESNETVINEIDDSICCALCGVVLEVFGLESYEENYVYRKGKERKEKRPNAIVYDWFERAAAFFSFTPELIEEGKALLRKCIGLLSSKFVMESGLAVVFSVGKKLNPNWLPDDYISSFPYPLYKPAVLKSCIAIEGPNFNMAHWISSQRQFDYFIDIIYGAIEISLFGTNPVPAKFNKAELKILTDRLMKFGNVYGINTGKKARVVITAVSCISALYLRTKAPIKRKRSSKTKIKQDYYHTWKFSHFTHFVFSTPQYIQRIYVEYYKLLVACVEKLPWIEQPIAKKEVFFYLDDILDLFGGEEPVMKLESNRIAPPSYLRNVNLAEEFAIALNDAKELIISDTEPENKSTLTCYIHKLLINDYNEDEFSAWSIDCIRSVCDMLDFRYTFNSLGGEANKDLDRILIGEDDLSNMELEFYLK